MIVADKETLDKLHKLLRLSFGLRNSDSVATQQSVGLGPDKFSEAWTPIHERRGNVYPMPFPSWRFVLAIMIPVLMAGGRRKRPRRGDCGSMGSEDAAMLGASKPTASYRSRCWLGYKRLQRVRMPHARKRSVMHEKSAARCQDWPSDLSRPAEVAPRTVSGVQVRPARGVSHQWRHAVATDGD